MVFLAALVAIFSRLPGALLHPQFFAEDGWVWYQQAYNLGWLRTLGITQAGCVQMLPRLVAGVTLLFPMQWAPYHELCRRRGSGAAGNCPAFPPLHALGSTTVPHVNGSALHRDSKRAGGPHCADQCHVAPGCASGSARLLRSAAQLARTPIGHHPIWRRTLLAGRSACFCFPGGGLLLDSPSELDTCRPGHALSGVHCQIFSLRALRQKPGSQPLGVNAIRLCYGS